MTNFKNILWKNIISMGITDYLTNCFGKILVMNISDEYINRQHKKLKAITSTQTTHCSFVSRRATITVLFFCNFIICIQFVRKYQFSAFSSKPRTVQPINKQLFN